MQTLSFQQNTGFNTGALIKRNQPSVADHDGIRSAVRAWAAAEGQDVVSAYIIEEWRQQGGDGIEFPEDLSRGRQKLFRYLDNQVESDKYREYVCLLTPAIMAVLPLEYRNRLMPHDDVLSRLSSAIKECAEAKQAVMLNAPEHQKLKEVSEGIASLFRLMPEQTGALMTIVSSMLGVM
ncbi:toxin YdaT domain-containing protein [Klebsiella michiganensis]|uniref:toxin YdaT domain-containing protein n=1 Tax=Klebsiella michiganensis TaxID=1134687 RepID=UPI00255AC004|nr:toxin YdaT domain-containing protein [Klebsiella michiganensis]MDL4445534.1 toxin YdaT domain-containing protein [Klebsiella michiganensis]MDL4485574.1 toxin YdaT domain-containing protein [Klebsiella michiganensis]MDL4660413.1 toxin YdaT domain-containing protein [Klebsiella michiganensis]